MTSDLSYSELCSIQDFFERFEYLKLTGVVGESTFGFDRYMNQGFYTSTTWRNLRHHIIARDNGCDLGVPGHEIHDKIIIHHINPLTQRDIQTQSYKLLDPDNLITVKATTHNAIHFGDANLLPREWAPRTLGDTTLWNRS